MTLWVVRQNAPWCPWYNLAMYLPEHAAMYQQEYEGIVTTAHATFADGAASLAIGTLATLLAVRGDAARNQHGIAGMWKNAAEPATPSHAGGVAGSRRWGM